MDGPFLCYWSGLQLSQEKREKIAGPMGIPTTAMQSATTPSRMRPYLYTLFEEIHSSLPCSIAPAMELEGVMRP